ncbi:response regulator [Rheinheimera riviphila]|nr:response regulator [Rheinheimera riviphila]
MESAANPKKTYPQMTVLLADSSDIVRDTVANMLLDLGFDKVLQASNGEHALHILSQQKIDFIIAEWDMPKMNGLELLQRVRADKRNASTVFMMMSVVIEQAAVVQAIKAGVSEYVVKPFTTKILLERVQRAIEGPQKANSAAKKPSDASGASTDTASNEPQQLRILVVDDVADNIQVISDILRKDYKVGAATSGEKALKICAAEPQPDLLLLDVMMPDINGFEVCRKLKANPLTQHISVIFLTALDQTQDMVRGFELGALDYITKPVNPPVVKARVKTHAALIQSVKQMRQQIDTLQENYRLKQQISRILQQHLLPPIQTMQQALHQLEQAPDDSNNVQRQSSELRSNCSYVSMQLEDLLALTKQE